MTAAGPGVVYVVAKAPRAGVAKTRLCPPLQPEEAARLAGAFLVDTLRIVRRASLEARVICRDAAEQAALRAHVGGLAAVHVQSGVGLGDALAGAFAHGLADGFDAVAVLGADSPTLPPEVLRQAFASLAQGAQVALGPCEDGGYYLLAARALYSELFADMPWSTSAVAALTLARCRASALAVHLLPTWYDVDDSGSLARLRADLLQAPAAVAPRTRWALAAQPPSITSTTSTHRPAAAAAARASAR